MRGRSRIYASNAEKQRAYRERKAIRKAIEPTVTSMREVWRVACQGAWQAVWQGASESTPKPAGGGKRAPRDG